jgi:hypothetical protein
MESRESGNPKGKTKELAAIQNAVKLKAFQGWRRDIEPRARVAGGAGRR